MRNKNASAVMYLAPCMQREAAGLLGKGRHSEEVGLYNYRPRISAMSVMMFLEIRAQILMTSFGHNLRHFISHAIVPMTSAPVLFSFVYYTD